MFFQKIIDLFTKKKPKKPPAPIIKQKVLFIVKKRVMPHYANNGGGTVSTGLSTSAKFVVDLVNTLPNVDAKLAEVNDNNDIDREVSIFKPDIVIIEALWVVPEKFDVLKKLHPKIKWIVRLHSDTPFLATEGVAFEWFPEYIKRGVIIGANSARMTNELAAIYGCKNTVYVPNYYPLGKEVVRRIPRMKAIDIGCFGAVRPMKNQLIQAIAAIKFANEHELKLRFHINGSRCEGNGDPVLRNIRALFDINDGHILIEHPWLSHSDFMKLLSHRIDISMQVSLTETYNIVAADSVSAGVPVVASHEINWIASRYQAEATCSESIAAVLSTAYSDGLLGRHSINYDGLVKNNQVAADAWIHLFK